MIINNEKLNVYFKLRSIFHLCLNNQCTRIERNFVLYVVSINVMSTSWLRFQKQLELPFTQFQYSALFSMCFLLCLFAVMCSITCIRFYTAILSNHTCNVTFRFTQFTRIFSVAVRAWKSHYVYTWCLFPYLAMKFV